jgi:hypothetical protein
MSHFRKFPIHPCLLIVLVIVSAVPVAAQKKQAKEPSTGLLREPPAPKECAQQSGNPINMLIVGDSILWGQGLEEKNKISFRVQEWICKQARRPVRLWREAHSGAIIGDPPKDVVSEARDSNNAQASPDGISKHHVSAGDATPAIELGGEVNVDNPTLWLQLKHAVDSLKGTPVDLVLMDGCINDFAVVEYLLDQTMTPDQVRDRSKAMCYDRMRPFLQKAVADFPHARFIVTGYYPVIDEKVFQECSVALSDWEISREREPTMVFAECERKDVSEPHTNLQRIWRVHEQLSAAECQRGECGRHADHLRSGLRPA